MLVSGKRIVQPAVGTQPRAPWVSFDDRANPLLSAWAAEGSQRRTPGPFGSSYEGNGSVTAGSYCTTNVRHLVASGTNVDSTAIACAFSGSSTGNEYLVSLGASGNVTGGYFRISRTAGVLSADVDDTANSGGVNASSTRSYADGRLHFAVALFRTGAGTSKYLDLFVDGVRVASFTGTTFNESVYNRFGVGILRRSSSSGWSQLGTRIYDAWYAKGLDYGSAREASKDMWTAAYGKRRIWVPVSAGGSTLTATLIEATAGTDLASASAVLSASLLDAAAGTDITSAQPTVARSLVDAAGGVDLVNSGVVVNGTLVEGVSAVDLSSALATLSVTVNEAVTVVELLAATRIANVAATEAAAGVDISSTGTSLSGSLVDAVVSADALSAAATLVASVLEAGGVVDQIHAAAQLVVLLTESAAGSDVVSRPAVYSVTATELVAALDVLSAAIEAAGLDPSARFTIAAKARRLTITAAARRLEIRK